MDDESQTVELQEGAWGDWVDPRDRYDDDPSFRPVNAMGYASGRIEDRESGKNRPAFETEQELDDIRASARMLCETSLAAQGALNNLTNYVMGPGYAYKATADSLTGDKSKAKLLQKFLDRFFDMNDWQGDLEREIFRRVHRDGEAFVSLWPSDGIPRVRLIDPEQIREPQTLPELGHCSKFGVDTADTDLEHLYGYHVLWNSVDPFDYITAWQVEHIKVNVDRKVKRGLSDFFAPGDDLRSARKLLRNMVRGASIQSAIPFIRQHASGTTKSQVEAVRSLNATSSRSETDQRGITRLVYGQTYQAGTVLDVSAGLEYKASPLASGEAANAYAAIMQASLRMIGVRWSMPEYMISGDASNANFASTIVSESPFVRFCEAEQAFFKRRLLRIIWRAVEMACQEGVIPCCYDEIEQCCEIQVEPPRLVNRNRAEDVAADTQLVEKKVMSKQTLAARYGLDYEQEQANIESEAPPPRESVVDPVEVPLAMPQIATVPAPQPPEPKAIIAPLPVAESVTMHDFRLPRFHRYP